jgi:hypothetical protein
VDALQSCKAFFVHGEDFHELPPYKIECPELRFLLVECDDGGPSQISNTFFHGTGKLKVLDLTQMQLSFLHH